MNELAPAVKKFIDDIVKINDDLKKEVEFWKKGYEDLQNEFNQLASNMSNSHRKLPPLNLNDENPFRQFGSKLGCYAPNACVSQKEGNCCEKDSSKVEKVRKVEFFGADCGTNLKEELELFFENIDYDFAQPKMHYSCLPDIRECLIENVMVEYFVKREG